MENGDCICEEGGGKEAGFPFLHDSVPGRISWEPVNVASERVFSVPEEALLPAGRVEVILAVALVVVVTVAGWAFPPAATIIDPLDVCREASVSSAAETMAPSLLLVDTVASAPVDDSMTLTASEVATEAVVGAAMEGVLVVAIDGWGIASSATPARFARGADPLPEAMVGVEPLLPPSSDGEEPLLANSSKKPLSPAAAISRGAVAKGRSRDGAPSSEVSSFRDTGLVERVLSVVTADPCDVATGMATTGVEGTAGTAVDTVDEAVVVVVDVFSVAFGRRRWFAFSLAAARLCRLRSRRFLSLASS